MREFQVRWWIEGAYGDPEGEEVVTAVSEGNAKQEVFRRVQAHFPNYILTGRLKMEVVTPLPDLQAENARLRAENAALKAALEPFAKIGAILSQRNIHPDYGRENRPVYSLNDAELMRADFIAAYLALPAAAPATPSEE